MELAKRFSPILEEEKENIAEDPSELFEYFLRGVYGFEDYENIRDYMQERKLFTAQELQEVL